MAMVKVNGTELTDHASNVRASDESLFSPANVRLCLFLKSLKMFFSQNKLRFVEIHYNDEVEMSWKLQSLLL